MTQLYINDQLAVIRDNTSFKFNVDNQVFSSQGSYSFEIALPLAGCAQNLRIFKAINHAEIGLNKLNGSFRLITEILSYEGKYKIVEVNEIEVKIQLLSDKTLANAESKDDKGNQLYIDEIPLGDFLDDYNLDKEVGPIEGGLGEPPYTMHEYCFYFQHGGQWRAHSTPPTTNCVNFPIVSTAYQDTIRVANPHEMNKLNEYVLTYTDNIAFQPQLLEVAKRICRYLGFSFISKLGDKGNCVFIANSRSKVHYSNILPHWTINEFFRELCNFFDAVILTNGNQITISKREHLFSDTPQYIDDVIYEFCANNNDESADDYSASGNVDYEWPDQDDMLRLPDEVYENAVLKEFANYKDIQTFFASLKEDERKLSRFIMKDRATGKSYAILQNDENSKFEMSRVDWYNPLLRESNRDIQTKLRIVPVRFGYYPVGPGIQAMPTMVVSDIINSDDVYSVNNAIKPDSSAAQDAEIADKRDVIEIFYHDGGISVSNDKISPIGVMVSNDKKTGLPTLIPFKSTTLRSDPAGPFQLQSIIKTNSEYNIKTNIEYQYKFIKKSPLDVNRPFVIRGRKYICKTLQYDCNAEGVQPIVLGYFYPLD